MGSVSSSISWKPTPVTLVKSSLGHDVWVQNEALIPFIRDAWDPKSIPALRKLLSSTLEIELSPRGFAKACDRACGSEGDPTHYDAVWVRDSVWIFHALKRDGQKDKARTLILALLDYFSGPEQIQRLQNIIRSPGLLHGPGGPMQVLHIRFDGNSKDLSDVRVNGEPQFWNHKQNDALGMFYAAIAQSLSEGLIRSAEITSAGWLFLIRLPTYFERIEFYTMEDAGAWEELERVNTSSIALVTDALEKWQSTFQKADVYEAAWKAASELGIRFEDEVVGNRQRWDLLIDQGYERVLRQLPFESPLHSAYSLQYRRADAALLNLLYPCHLRRLSTQNFLSVVETVETLAGERGIRRYFSDAYQSGNYWLKDLKSAGIQSPDALTDDCSKPEDFEKRTAHMLEGTEAQWFFDSWLSFGLGRLIEAGDLTETMRCQLKNKQLHYLHRALGQITGGTPTALVLGADGKPVTPFACPESYNTILDTVGDGDSEKRGEKHFAPSPITPLNWAKASLILALNAVAHTR